MGLDLFLMQTLYVALCSLVLLIAAVAYSSVE